MATSSLVNGVIVLELPKHIESRIRDYISLSQRANSARQDIDTWFLKKGIDATPGTASLLGLVLNDLLIDGSQDGTPEETLALVKRELEVNCIRRG